MTITTVDSCDRHHHHLQLNSIPLVDLRFLSQSELNSLSLCSDDAFDLRRCDDVVVPKIDRSVFNESAGSRKQTYSRLRLARRESDISDRHRRRTSPSLLPKAPPSLSDDSEKRENKRIVELLLDLFAKTDPKSDLTLAVVEHGGNDNVRHDSSVIHGSVAGRRRSRKKADDADLEMVVYGTNLEDRDTAVLNRNGGVVDVAALAGDQDPFFLELKKRTEGLETEAECLEFLTGLEGQWGSRRKKRKIVDAGDFGDGLPVGWKILLALKRKEGRVSLNCRRYISPNGIQFDSCKDVSSYLLPFVGPQDASLCENTRGIYKLVDTAGLTHKNDIRMEDPICYSAAPISSISADHEKQIILFSVGNPAQAQPQNVLECHRCKLSFDDKDAYLLHLLSVHQKNGRRCRLGNTIGEGVIIKDGKYICQFCQKAFTEKHRYNGHVGIHVRNYVRSLETLPDKMNVEKGVGPSSLSAISSVSETDPSVKLDNSKDSVSETSTAKSNDGLNVGSPHDAQAMENSKDDDIPKPSALEINHETLASKLNGEQDNEMIDDKVENECNSTLDVRPDACLDSAVPMPTNGENEQILPSTILDGTDESGKDEERSFESFLDTFSAKSDNVGTSSNDDLTCGTEEPVLDEMEKSENELGSGFVSNHVRPDKDGIAETIESTDDENVLQSMVADMSLPSSDCFFTLDMISEKGEDEFSSVTEKLENVTDFDELKLDDIGPTKFSFMNGQDPSCLPEATMELDCGAELVQGLDPSVRFELDMVLPEMVSRDQLTTLCVWCRLEFILEGVNAETESDSVGFMCPDCKAKISGQINVLDNGLPLNTDQL